MQSPRSKNKRRVNPIAGHPSRFLTIFYAEIKNVLVNVEIGSERGYNKNLYGQRQITDIFTIDVNNLVVSDKTPCNNGKDCGNIETLSS